MRSVSSYATDSTSSTETDSEPSNKRPLKSFLLSKEPYQDNSLEKQCLNDLLVNYIVGSNQPLSIVDDPKLIKFLNKLNPKYRVPCRQTITNKLKPEKTKEAKNNLQLLFNNINYCSATCDGWTSLANQSYLVRKLAIIKYICE